MPAYILLLIIINASLFPFVHFGSSGNQRRFWQCPPLD
jgi:hypothetical protein